MEALKFTLDELCGFNCSGYGTSHGLDDELLVALFEVVVRIGQIGEAGLIAGGNAHFVFVLGLLLLLEDSSVLLHDSS